MLVTAADFGPDAYEFVKGTPLTLLSGSNFAFPIFPGYVTSGALFRHNRGSMPKAVVLTTSTRANDGYSG